MPHVAIVFGTRPEAIKMAPLVQAIESAPTLRQSVVVTGQHRQMLDQVLKLFSIVPDLDLDLMTPDQSLADLTSRVLCGLAECFAKTQPDIVIVQGDTTTSFAAALAAFYHQIPVGHVEAGLRTGDPYAPWPEEINRQLTSRIATLHFAPTQRSRANLLAENIPSAAIEVTGNTVIDALLWVSEQLDEGLANGDLSVEVLMGQNSEQKPLRKRQIEALRSATSNGGRLVLITGHRRENFGAGFQRICYGIKELAERYPKVVFFYPLHLNPRVMKPVTSLLGHCSNVHLIPPLDYLPFVYLMKQCTLVLTDSGGIQEEAPGLGKPVLVMRETTERPEALEAGTVELVGSDVDRIVGGVSRLLDDPEHYRRMSRAHNPFGDGKASERIVDRLVRQF